MVGKHCHIVMEVSVVFPSQDLKHYVYSFSIHCPVCQAVHESSRLCPAELQLQNERLLYFCLPFSPMTTIITGELCSSPFSICTSVLTFVSSFCILIRGRQV